MCKRIRMIQVAKFIEDDFTVDEMIGVMKWLRITEGRDCCEYYMDQLLEWQEDGFGEVTVSSCKETIP